jgi:hypothetical protein
MGYRSITDFIFNRKTIPPFSEGIFRTVPGRPLPTESNADPVRVVNNDEYGLTLSVFTLTTANTEYQIRGIQTMSAIVIKARGGPVQFSIYEGQSGSVYTLLADGQSLEISAIPFGNINSPVTFFVRSTTAGCVVELLGMRLM